MNRIRLALTALAASASLVAGAVAVTTLQPEAEPTMPTPTAEHEALLMLVGTWDASMSMSMGPDMQMEATGTEVNRAVGPFHIVSDFKASFDGMPFSGHGTHSWDPVKGTFVSVWIDSTEPTPMILTGGWTEPGRVMEMKGKGMMAGQMSDIREVITVNGPDQRTFEMHMTPEGGPEMKIMTIEYTRKK